MTAFLRFMITPAGRVLRVVAGIALAFVAAMLAGGWWALLAIAALLVVSGVGDLCPLAILGRKPVIGRRLRAQLSA